MDVLQLLQNVNNFGAAPLSLIMIFLVGYLIKQIKKNGDEDKERHKSTRSEIQTSIGAIQKQFADAIAELKTSIEKRLDNIEYRLKIVEKDYVQKEDHYRDIGGWRTEINNLSSYINRQMSSFMEQIIKIWSNKNA
jgi:hypothetical protein